MRFDDDDIAAILDAVSDEAVLIEISGTETPITVDYSAPGSIVMGQIIDKPIITCAEKLFAGVDIKNAVIVHDTIQYRMISPLPDGDGFITVTLVRI